MSKKTQFTQWCRIEGCCNAASRTLNGINLCERCRTNFVPVGSGAVFFGIQWHGVIGATYTAEQGKAYPGLIPRELPSLYNMDPRNGPWARQSRD